MTRYPFAVAASLIEDEHMRQAFIRRATRNAVSPYRIIRDHHDPQRQPKASRKR